MRGRTTWLPQCLAIWVRGYLPWVPEVPRSLQLFTTVFEWLTLEIEAYLASQCRDDYWKRFGCVILAYFRLESKYFPPQKHAAASVHLWVPRRLSQCCQWVCSWVLFHRCNCDVDCRGNAVPCHRGRILRIWFWLAVHFRNGNERKEGRSPQEAAWHPSCRQERNDSDYHEASEAVRANERLALHWLHPTRLAWVVGELCTRMSWDEFGANLEGWEAGEFCCSPRPSSRRVLCSVSCRVCFCRVVSCCVASCLVFRRVCLCRVASRLVVWRRTVSCCVVSRCVLLPLVASCRVLRLVVVSCVASCVVSRNVVSCRALCRVALRLLVSRRIVSRRVVSRCVVSCRVLRLVVVSCVASCVVVSRNVVSCRVLCFVVSACVVSLCVFLYLVASCRVVSCRVVLRRVVSCRVASCRAVSRRVASCCVVSRRVASCCVVLRRVASCCVVSCRVVLRRVVSRRVASCCVVSCRVVSRRVASCRVVSRRVASCRIVSRRVVSCRVGPNRVVFSGWRRTLPRTWWRPATWAWCSARRWWSRARRPWRPSWTSSTRASLSSSWSRNTKMWAHNWHSTLAADVNAAEVTFYQRHFGGTTRTPLVQVDVEVTSLLIWRHFRCQQSRPWLWEFQSEMFDTFAQMVYAQRKKFAILLCGKFAHFGFFHLRSADHPLTRARDENAGQRNGGLRRISMYRMWLQVVTITCLTSLADLWSGWGKGGRVDRFGSHDAHNAETETAAPAQNVRAEQQRGGADRKPSCQACTRLQAAPVSEVVPRPSPSPDGRQTYCALQEAARYPPPLNRWEKRTGVVRGHICCDAVSMTVWRHCQLSIR